MTDADDWDVFVQSHGQIVGYDMDGEVFLPVGPGGDGMVRRTCEAFGRPYPPGMPVWGPKAEESRRG